MDVGMNDDYVDLQHTWMGEIDQEEIGEGEAKKRNTLADAAKQCKWDIVLNIVHDDPTLVNSVRPGTRKFYSPLHQAAYGMAPNEVVRALIDAGGWLLLRNAEGFTPEMVASHRGNAVLANLLAPRTWVDVPGEILHAIELEFHHLIRKRTDHLIRYRRLRLPELGPCLEKQRGTFWFAVPKMTGGFAYRLANDRDGVKLVTESWCRVSMYSGQRHIVTERGSTLVAEGF